MDKVFVEQLDAPAPDWFRWALAQRPTDHVVEVAGCPIHYLLWPATEEARPGRGLLLVHGGGAHAHWWAFIAPYFLRDFRVAALDFSGMGDSGRREDYSAEVRAEEMRAVIDDAGLGETFVVGHSFGGYMTMKFCAVYGDEIAGAVIVDSPVRDPDEKWDHPPGGPPGSRGKRLYPDFASALARFRLMPEQPCPNPFIVEYIARRSIHAEDGGYAWKFDANAMGARRFGEPFHEHLQALRCRAALVFGEHSKLVSRRTAAYMSRLMGPQAPIVEVPEAQHHVFLDQPLAFVACLRALLDGWSRA